MSQTIENERKLTEEIKEHIKKALLLEKDLQNATVINSTLDRRVVDLQFKADRVPILESEKRAAEEKHKADLRRLEVSEKRIRDLESELQQ